MLISIIFIFLSITIIMIAFLAVEHLELKKILILTTASSVLILSCELIRIFDNSQVIFREIFTFFMGPQVFNLTYLCGLDGLSLIIFFLSAFLIFVCTIFVQEEVFFLDSILNLLWIELFLLITVTALDLFALYLFFVTLLIPMYIIIRFWGLKARKSRAVYLFFGYTLWGSILIIYIYNLVDTLYWEKLNTWNFTDKEQKLLWLTFFLSLAYKVPMFIFHRWLPEYVEEPEPTLRSVLVAGILLKLGVYGFLRFSLVLFPDASFFYSPMVYLFFIFGIIYASFEAIKCLFASLILEIRNPGLKEDLFKVAILGFALTEVIALFALMRAFLVLFA